MPKITIQIDGVEHVPVPVSMAEDAADTADAMADSLESQTWSSDQAPSYREDAERWRALLGTPAPPPVIEPVEPKWPWSEDYGITTMQPSGSLSVVPESGSGCVIYLKGDQRGPLGQVRGLSGTPDKPLWIVRHPDDGPLSIDATRDEFAVKLVDCKHLRFYGFDVLGKQGNCCEIGEGCEDIEFINVTADGGKFGFLAQQTTSNVIRDIWFRDCLARNQTKSNYFANGVFGNWGFERCIGRDNKGTDDKSQIFYVTAMNSAPTATDCSAVNGPMTGFQFRAGVKASGLFVRGCASGILLGGLDGFEPVKFQNSKTGSLRDSVVMDSHGTPSGQYFHKGVEVQNGKYDIVRNVTTGVGVGFDVNGKCAGVYRVASAVGARNIVHEETTHPVRVLNGGSVPMEWDWMYRSPELTAALALPDSDPRAQYTAMMRAAFGGGE